MEEIWLLIFIRLDLYSSPSGRDLISSLFSSQIREIEYDKELDSWEERLISILILLLIDEGIIPFSFIIIDFIYEIKRGKE